jgi:hypothetical protein
MILSTKGMDWKRSDSYIEREKKKKIEEAELKGNYQGRAHTSQELARV